MQVQNILSGYTDPATRRPTDLLDSIAIRTVGDTDDAERARRLASGVAARNVLETYDVTKITPRQFTEMIQRLFDARAISQQEFDQLAAIRLELDVAGIDPDQSVDLLQFYRDKIEETQRQGGRDAAVPDALRHRLDWIEKFALVQASPEAFGLDALA